ncbi:hypothetical protein [Bradyrhizobium sp. AUGA SZCCT0283]|uniref:hypothetical protein n=1 Tax=Bradyrhizobium sp. AUGA SZCCT0283 TaxID=2807671 RepID=UPI001BAD2BF8|nr:hypothetical protein [Bradyrhizobium sp. AUGA SZCCT0283]MBR1279977.1 hypothetical protein [Bradyrhizobium sp. AUGA SZCCT0283]
MGRPIGSVNREKPFNEALRVALLSHPLRLRRIAEKLTERAEEGDLAAIRELADRLDGKPAQVVDRRDAVAEELSDAELYLIASGGLPPKPQVLLIPPARKVKG